VDVARKVVGALLVVIAVCPATVAAAQEAPHPVRIGAAEPIVLGEDPVVVDLFNDGGVDVPVIAIEAYVRSSAGAGAITSVKVAFEVDLGSGFGSLGNGAEITATNRALIRLTRPANAPAPAVGQVRVVLSVNGTTIVVRQDLQIAAPAVTAGVTTWMVTSRSSWPWQHDGGSLGNPIPLATATDCTTAGSPTGVLATGDDTVSVSGSCEGAALHLVFGSIPRAGSYKGKLKVGDTEVDLELRRTFALWWPVLLILAGFAAALWSQGRLNQGWRGQQRWWLSRFPARATRADEQFHHASSGKNWETYQLAAAVDAKTTDLRDRLNTIAKSRSPLIRFLPWPDTYAQTERDAIRTEISTLESLIADWPTMAGALNTAHERLFSQSYYPRRAPAFAERIRQILIPGDAVLDVDELDSRRLETKAVPEAFTIVDHLEELDRYLQALEAVDGDRPSADLETLRRARQLERQASAELREITDARQVSSDVASTVRRATRLASRLPRPMPARADGSVVTETYVAAPDELHLSILGVLRRYVAATLGRGLEVGHTAMILLSLTVGVWSGLALLYTGKAWGESVRDFIAAFVWGFGSSVVLAPVVSAVKQLGTRPSDKDAAVTA
jgi:hypothetical protein